MQKSMEQLHAELAHAKDTLLNEVSHRQQLGAQLQDAAMQMRNFQSMVMADMQAIRTAAKSKNVTEILAIVERSIGQEPKEPVAPVADEPQAAK